MNGLKFKVGDRVKVVRECEQNGCIICPHILGQRGTIKSIRNLEAIGIMISFEETPLYEAKIEQIDLIEDNTPLPLPG